MYHDETKYKARAWRTDVLRKQAQAEVAKMLEAFVPNGFHIRIEEVETDVPGFPFAPPFKFTGVLEATDRNGSDAHFFVNAYTREGVRAKLLAYILDGQGFFPMT